MTLALTPAQDFLARHRMVLFDVHLEHAQPDDPYRAADFQARPRHHDTRALRESLAA
ncbi:hypothetical protein GCM10011521_25280 [Arenimonas soli]|uniref:Uncharacterized protein n=1 Tax=Arenimonas soli TaxID=2269504 RepID=A0ABQ1HRH3_9GAMM|nr:hypothetical protein [Arenimonas soli]GGA85775.1 hypothetical protein GCM10011521_25280 [Arenimonas soli]